jgi:type IV secretion system protein VirD4
MKSTRILLAVAPGALMLLVLFGLAGIDEWIASFGPTPNARVILGRIGIALPYAAAAAFAIIFLFAARGALSIRSAGAGVLIGAAAVTSIAAIREVMRLLSFADTGPRGRGILDYPDPATAIGATMVGVVGVFALRVAMRGNGAFASPAPRRAAFTASARFTAMPTGCC